MATHATQRTCAIVSTVPSCVRSAFCTHSSRSCCSPSRHISELLCARPSTSRNSHSTSTRSRSYLTRSYQGSGFCVCSTGHRRIGPRACWNGSQLAMVGRCASTTVMSENCCILWPSLQRGTVLHRHLPSRIRSRSCQMSIHSCQMLAQMTRLLLQPLLRLLSRPPSANVHAPAAHRPSRPYGC